MLLKVDLKIYVTLQPYAAMNACIAMNNYKNEDTGFRFFFYFLFL